MRYVLVVTVCEPETFGRFNSFHFEMFSERSGLTKKTSFHWYQLKTQHSNPRSLAQTMTSDDGGRKLSPNRSKQPAVPPSIQSRSGAHPSLLAEAEIYGELGRTYCGCC